MPEKCKVCSKSVYPVEELKADDFIFHKSCFRCHQCNCVLKLGTYASMNYEFFCKNCFKKNFYSKGNYSEGFGKLKPQHEFEAKKGGERPEGSTAPSTITQEKAAQAPTEVAREEKPKRPVAAPSTRSTLQAFKLKETAAKQSFVSSTLPRNFGKRASRNNVSELFLQKVSEEQHTKETSKPISPSLQSGNVRSTLQAFKLKETETKTEEGSSAKPSGRVRPVSVSLGAKFWQESSQPAKPEETQAPNSTREPEGETSELKKRITQLESEAKESEDKLKQLNEQLKEAKESQKPQEDSNAEKQKPQEDSSADSGVEELQKQLQQLEHQKEVLEENSKKAEQKAEKAEEQIQEKSNQIEELDKQNQELQEQGKQAEQKNQELEQTNQDLKQKNQELEQANQDLKQKIQELEQKSQQSEQTSKGNDETPVSDTQELQEQNQKLQSENEIATQEIEKLKNLVEKFKTELNELNQDVEDLEDENQKLTEELKQLKN